jgi:hypothetical protein
LWSRHCNRAPLCGDVMERLMAARVFPSLYNLSEVGFESGVIPALDMAFGPSQILFGLTKRSRWRSVWSYQTVITTVRVVVKPSDFLQ